MDYATQHHKRGGNARRKTATAASHEPIGVYGLYETSQGCAGSTAGHPAARPGGAAADGFLRAVFAPALKENKSLRGSIENNTIADGFCASFKQLTAHYGIALPMPMPFCYPDTIAQCMSLLQEALKQVEGFYSLRLVQGSKGAFLVSEERHSTGQSLYYLPVVPLYKMLRDKHHKKAAALLLSVGAWLYRIVNVPYYRQEETYLYYQYDMVKEWVEQDTDEEYDSTERQDLEAAATIGDRMEQKLRHPANLEYFTQRLGGFRAWDDVDRECLAVATNAQALFLEYPNESVFRNAPVKEETEDDAAYYDNEVISMDKYISFSADTEGWLFDTVADTVNSDFNECGEIEEPQLLKCFDGNPVTGSLDFERRVFDLMDRLCDILYNYKMP
ncbi:hypothetical protein GR160_06195 [Flavobacterium sp. Sd200]|uniref:hypothetical protein n=1 Tax=Flavobacterium sp. Sd200 TaxID=2692211 RepID=UPI00136AC643|nr:hypothetical protein [Flavobacterium sp. Sd200]MXN90812.1 hypothetical protein [Flavobacterium sp. Sd200]